MSILPVGVLLELVVSIYSSVGAIVDRNKLFYFPPVNHDNHCKHYLPLTLPVVFMIAGEA